MSVIGHWTVAYWPDKPHIAPLLMPKGHKLHPNDRLADGAVTVEVVPAEQLRGAVEALEKIECAYKRTMPGPRDALRDRVLEIIATYRPGEP